ncbi:MAG TPA: PAS domain S-box protein [Oculatellaceae cyanobacterium]|jgi:PAS domain S-box-containing protein
MNSTLKKIFLPRNNQYLQLGENLEILDFSDGILPFANCPNELIIGQDARSYFPELIGAEERLNLIMQGHDISFEIKGICRFLEQEKPLYFDLYTSKKNTETCLEKQLIFFLEDVTEKMLLQQQLEQKNHEKNILLNSITGYRNYINRIFAAMGDALLVTTKSGIIKTINQATESLLGYSVEEIIGKHISHFIKNTNFLPQEHQLCLLFESEHLQNIEASCYTKNQEEIFVAFSCSAIKSEVEGLYNFIYVGRNITERKRSELELRRQNQRSQLLATITLKIRQSLHLEEILQTTVNEVRSLLQVDRVLILRVFPDGTGSAVVTESVASHLPSLLNRQFLPEIFPIEYHQMYRQGRIQAIEALENAQISPCHAQFLEDLGVQSKLVVPIIYADELWGLLIAHQCHSQRAWDNFEIELLQQLANQAAITISQSQLLQAVQESEKQFRQLTENINEVFWLFDPEKNQVLYISPAYEKLWGHHRESLYKHPQSWLDAVYLEDRDRVIAAVEKSHQIQEFFNQEYRIIGADGSLRWVWAREFPIQNEFGEIYRIAGIAENITDRKQAEEEINKSLQQEKELNELKSGFISMVSHEFRTPLSTILLSSELLQNYSHKWDQEKKNKAFKRIHSSVKTMSQLLEDVLVIGKSEAGKQEFNPVLLNPILFCEELVSEIELTIAFTHKINFVSKGDGNNAYLDEKLLRQILNNLMTNAVKYSSPSSTVHLLCDCQEETVVFEVRDEGIGIPIEDQKHLFETFHRATNVGQIPGTGLGLAIVKQSVDLHQGEINIQSQVGAGTTFIVKLPTNCQQQAEAIILAQDYAL